jgi:ABC-2 type transport system permease protein
MRFLQSYQRNNVTINRYIMKTIYKIAWTELQTLFYSPVAWLIIVIFAFQAAMIFVGSFSFGGVVESQALRYGNGANMATFRIFSNPLGGLFPAIQGYLYLYIPLLTMGLMSRELSSGSIKLLYSSPVTNAQIILGKFLSMMIYGLALIAILMFFVVFCTFTVKDLDLPAVLTGILGLYLLICAYSAVGLFMSSLTSYQVAAAVLTLAMLAILNYVKVWWQDIELVREITYWLSISGRADGFINGLICSEDLLYFIIVTALFLGLTVVRLQSNRQKSPLTVMLGKYIGVLLLACLLGYISSRPHLMTYYDATDMKTNTLTPNSQEVIAKLEGGLTITTYVNALDEKDLWAGLPVNMKNDQELFRPYMRFKPEIKMKYVYYYDTVTSPSQDKRYPDLNTEQRAKEIMRIHGLDSNMFLKPEEIRAQIDLLPEKNKFVRVLERESGEKTFLRVYNDMGHFPREAEITAAFKRIVMDLPKVGFLTGHGERDIKKLGDRDYNSFTLDKSFRYALINQGFDIENVTLDKEVNPEIRILVIAEVRDEMSEVECENLDKYIACGGNLLIMNEPKSAGNIEPLLAKLGVKVVPGTLVRQTENFSPDLILSSPTKEAGEMAYWFENMIKENQVIVTPGVSGLEYSTDKGYQVTPLFLTDSLVWNELETTNFVDDAIELNEEAGEVQQRYATGLALTRKLGDKEQKIMIFGDADCISNGELGMFRQDILANNFNIVMGSFFWMSDEEVPVDVRRPDPLDNQVYMDEKGLATWKVIMMWIIPGLLVIFSILIWIRRRGR